MVTDVVTFIKRLAFSVKEHYFFYYTSYFNPLNAELNPICYLLALLRSSPFSPR